MPEPIKISPKLKEVLSKICHKSNVAHRLLEIIPKEDLLEDPVDYISISSDDPTKISYAYSHRLAKLKEGEDPWTFKGRIHAKPATAIKKFLKNVKENDLDVFTNLYRAETAEKNFKFKIVDGEDIKKYYRDNTYAANTGSLYKSCMKYDYCEPYFKLYINNPEVCKMLVMLDNNNYLLGRALLWEVKEFETDKELKIMDRIYCVDDTRDIHYFKEWADKNGYLHRKDQKWQNSLQFEFNGKKIVKKIYTTIKDIGYDRFPYCDTLKFLDTNNLILTNFKPDKYDKNFYALIAANGAYCYADQLEYDTVREVYDHREYMNTLSYLINGEYARTTNENIVYSNCLDMNIAMQHAVWNEELKDNIFIEELSQYNDEDKINKRKEMIKNNKEKMKKKISSFSEYYSMNEGEYQIYNDVSFYTLGENVETITINTDGIVNYINEVEPTTTTETQNTVLQEGIPVGYNNSIFGNIGYNIEISGNDFLIDQEESIRQSIYGESRYMEYITDEQPIIETAYQPIMENNENNTDTIETTENIANNETTENFARIWSEAVQRVVIRRNNL